LLQSSTETDGSSRADQAGILGNFLTSGYPRDYSDPGPMLIHDPPE
jgi:hypothetical protein